MRIRNLAAPAAALAFALSFGIANADTPLLVSCSGTAATLSITWTATSTGGVSPIAYLWGNGSTSTSQSVSYVPGTYSMNIQATDASSSVATSTCAATVAQAQTAPTILSFSANPASITVGQSTTLSWSVEGASSTSIDNGVGSVASTSLTVSPATTTTYMLTATNPVGTTTSQATVAVNATSTPTSIQAQIAALLQQIAQLQQQIRNLIAGQTGTGTTTPPTIMPPGQIGKGMCIALNRNLREGDDGDDVMQLQQMLAGDPSLGFTAAPTGYFGPMTLHAMMRFQLQNDIASSSNASGYVGPLTRGFFERRCGEGLGNGSDNNSNSASSTRIENPEEGHGDVWWNASTTPTQGLIQNLKFENGHGNGNGRGHDN